MTGCCVTCICFSKNIPFLTHLRKILTISSGPTLLICACRIRIRVVAVLKPKTNKKNILKPKIFTISTTTFKSFIIQRASESRVGSNKYFLYRIFFSSSFLIDKSLVHLHHLNQRLLRYSLYRQRVLLDLYRPRYHQKISFDHFFCVATRLDFIKFKLFLSFVCNNRRCEMNKTNVRCSYTVRKVRKYSTVLFY